MYVRHIWPENIHILRQQLDLVQQGLNSDINIICAVKY